jgi:TrpR-related protein YerC/YecD
MHSSQAADDYPTAAMTDLFSAILTLSSPAEAAAFFRDLLTLPELAEFANRWQAVRMLTEGKPYHEISKTLGMSTTTVARVAHWLNHGEGGYRTVAGRMFPQK